MRQLSTEVVHLFFVVPLYVVAWFVWCAFKAHRRPPGTWSRRLRYVYVGLAAVTYLLCVPAWPNLMLGKLESTYPALTAQQAQQALQPKDTAIVVLAGGWFRDTGSSFEIKLGVNSWERLWCAVQLHDTLGGTLVFAGAPLPDGSTSVAGEMARIAVRLGVPAEQVRVEAASRNTYENLLFTQKQGLLDDRNVVVVTTAVHMPRTMAVTRQLGIDAVAFPCDFRAEEIKGWRRWVPQNDALPSLEDALHEVLALQWYRQRGWAD
jgi:uncharacterized SAM-binding protein YcdF (DUF218 family)